MFSSIRARLWLSYAGVIVIALCSAAIVLTTFLIRNPYTYRQAAVRIAAGESLMRRDPLTAASMQGEAAEALGVRILIISAGGEVRRDTAPEQGAFRNLASNRRVGQVNATRDLDGDAWLYSKTRLPSGDWQVVATPRPGLQPLLEVVRDELWRPLIQAALIALVLALGVTYLLARWIADPLQALIQAARSTATSGGQAPEAVITPEKGPREARELTRAFNAMLKRVSASQRSQKEFVANVSHELKTPLTAIQGFSQAMLDGTAASDESRRQAAEVIQREARRMYRLATDLLDLARLDSGSVELRKEPVNLGQLLVGMRERFQSMAAAADVAVEMDVSPTVPSITGDGDRLAQALGNIIENAIKFSPQAGRVQLTTEVSAREVCVVITDAGPGIPENELGRIFDRFYQVDPSRGGGRQHGAGLGLAIARQVVEGHGGKIHVRSTIGHGAEFRVHLPRRGEQQG